MLNRAEAAPSSATPNQNHSAAAGKAQTRPPAGIVEQPAAVLAFPTRNSNFARACVATLDLSPGCRITANTIADFGAVHSRPQKSRHIQAGDCAAYPGAAAIRRKRPGRRKICLKTIRNHIAEFLAAADAAGGVVERRRTVRTNTYIFKLSEQQKAPGIRAEIADNCTLLCTPVCTPIEPRREEDQVQDQVQDQKNCARDPSTATTTTTTAVRTDADSTGRDPGPACAPETSPPPRDPSTATTTTTTAVRTNADSTGRDPGPACAPETSPPPRDPSTATTTTTTAVRTNADSTGRDPGPACAPETSPPAARRTPANDKPATEAQLEYLAFLADEVATDQPSPATLTARTADRVIRDLTARYAPRRERRDRRRQPVPSTVQAQSDRTDRTAPIHGCPASACRHRIDVLAVTLEQWRSRTDPAIVQAWKNELAQLITEEDRHREGLRPPGSSAAGSPPAPAAPVTTECNDGRQRPTATRAS